MRGSEKIDGGGQFQQWRRPCKTIVAQNIGIFGIAKLPYHGIVRNLLAEYHACRPGEIQNGSDVLLPGPWSRLVSHRGTVLKLSQDPGEARSTQLAKRLGIIADIIDVGLCRGERLTWSECCARWSASTRYNTNRSSRLQKRGIRQSPLGKEFTQFLYISRLSGLSS